MMHEAQLHESNWFLTLTFSDDHLLKRDFPMSLDKRDFQLFMKRLRKRFGKVRYFMCGEYGDIFKRPHYHAILFGIDFLDRELHSIKDGMRYYTSKSISDLWPYGFNILTDVTFDTCAYVARYIMKKHLGKDAHLQYDGNLNPETGEMIGHRIPEYTTMSRRSGIGKAWLEKYLQDVFPRDKVFVSDKKIFCKPPKAYDSYYEIINPVDFARIKSDRVASALINQPDDVQRHLHASKVIKEQQISILKRNLE